MKNSFGATSTADEVLRGIDLSGKRVLVTGVSYALDPQRAQALWRKSEELVCERFKVN